MGGDLKKKANWGINLFFGIVSQVKCNMMLIQRAIHPITKITVNLA